VDTGFEDGIVKKCPMCSKPLAFVPQFNQWYCHECNTYPYLRQDASQYNYRFSTKNSVLNIISAITFIFLIVIMILYVIGLTLLHASVLSGYDDRSGWDEDLIRALFDLGLALVLFVIVRVFLAFTVSDRTWWMKYRSILNGEGITRTENLRLRKVVIDLFGLFYGAFIIMGIILFIVGVMMINVLDADALVIGLADVIIGPVVIYVAYKLYLYDISNITRNIYPVFPPVDE